MFGKILAGVAIGVGAVAAAPFTGGGSLLGAATLASSLAGTGAVAAAAGAGMVGGAAGAIVADSSKTKEKAIHSAGKVEGKAEVQQKVEALEAKLRKALNHLESHDQMFNAIIALEATGVACAACDGDFSEAEKEEIGEFVKGMMAQAIPQEIKNKIQSIYDNPPTVKEAFKLAEDSGLEMSIFEEMIRFVSEIDGITYEEQVFFHSWKQLKVAA